MSLQTELAPDYYLCNFKQLINHARTWYASLLTIEESDWLQKFEQLDTPSQCLLVRFLMRKGEWFRSDKLHYSEINDIPARADRLQQAGFIDINPPLTPFCAASALLTKAELLRCYPELPATQTKSALLTTLDNLHKAPLPGVSFDYYYLRHAHIIRTLLVLFFANARQDLSQFVLSDLGLNKFEHYRLASEQSFFHSRAELEQLLVLHAIAEAYADLKKPRETQELLALLTQIGPATQHAYVNRRRQRMINTLARDLERCGAEDEALHWFGKTSLAPSRERQARIYLQRHDWQRAQALIQQMQANTQDIQEQEVAVTLQRSLQRKQGVKLTNQSKPQFNQQNLCLDLSDKRVELAVLEHYQQQGWQVFYAENHFLNGLFGLTFWNVIFADVQGAFINPYQARPLDLYHGEFCQRRAPQIKQTLTHIKQHGLSHLRQRYRDKYATTNTLVNWTVFTPQLLECALHALRADLLLALFQIQLQDLRTYRSGMPDLIAFKDDDFRWIEVKGPGDKLQASQWRWIRQFERLNVPFYLCQVEDICGEANSV